MATLYVDPAAAGANNGSSWTDAWTSVQSAIDYVSLAAGDVVYMRGTQTPSAQIDFDGAKGNYANGRIRFVGCNSGGTVDGTRFHLNFGNNAIHGCVFNDMDSVSLENVEISSSYASGTYHGLRFVTSGSSNCAFVNVYIHDWSGMGQEGILGYYATWDRCRAANCGSYGFQAAAYSNQFWGCVADGNGNTGFYAYYGAASFRSCLSYGNTGGYGFYLGVSSALFGCVAHNNSSGGVYFNGVSDLRRCRITANGGYGINVLGSSSARPSICGCYFHGNTSGVASGNYQEINPDGAGSWNELAGSDTDYGYVDSASGDFNIAAGATLRSKALVLQ